MKLRLIALATVAAAAMVATSPASAQDPRGARAPMVTFSGPPTPDQGATACRGSSRAFNCGVRAYDYYGPRQGLRWFQLGARRGSAPSMRAIGMILMRGDRGVAADPAAAMGWFYEAALRNDATSMYALSVGFEHGAGVARDPALARYWLERAASAGSDQARRALREAQ